MTTYPHRHRVPWKPGARPAGGDEPDRAEGAESGGSNARPLAQGHGSAFQGHGTPFAEGFGLSNQQGVIVQNVVKGSPAERAGLERNDVIVEMNGQPVTDSDKFRFKIADIPPGTRVKLGLLREGKRLAVEVVLADKATLLAATQQVPDAGGEESGDVGMVVRDLTSAEKAEFKVQSGVRVTQVAEDSEAQDKDIQANDIIEEVNRVAVNSAAEFRAQVAKVRKAGKPVVITSSGNTVVR